MRKPSEIPVRCQFTRLVSPHDITKHPHNPNEHPAAQVKLFAKIIRHQGWRSPIIVSNRSGYIVAGHGKLEAALLIGCPQVPVDYQDFETEQDEIAHLLADNELAQLAERNKSTVESLLKDLETKDFDLELTGILEALQDPAKLERVAYIKPPRMTYVLIAIPTVKFGEINQHVEAIAANPESQVETAVCDK